MDTVELIFWIIVMTPMAIRAVVDNIRIQRDYFRMAEELVDGIAISPETAEAFRGFFKWCARTHQFMIYMVASHLGYFILNGGSSTFEASVISFELLVMALIHYPQQLFTQRVLTNFFKIDLPRLTEALGVENE